MHDLISPRLQYTYLVMPAVTGEGQNRQSAKLRFCAKPFDHFNAITFRHINVSYDHIWLLAHGLLKSIVTVLGCDYNESFQAKERSPHFSRITIVFNNENLSRQECLFPLINPHKRVRILYIERQT